MVRKIDLKGNYVDNQLGKSQKRTVDLAVLQTSFVPPGVVFPFCGTSAPSGWLLCNGSAVSRSTYAALFAVIASNFGYGDNSTTFNLPDFRGRFPRGMDGGTGRDPDRASRSASNTGGNTGDAVGSVQGQATAKNGLANSNSSIGGTAAGQGYSGNSGSVDSQGSHAHGQPAFWAGGDNGHRGGSGTASQANGTADSPWYLGYDGGHAHTVSISHSHGDSSVSGTA